MAGRLEGKVAVLTGAAGGIGRALAEGFLREGARVVGIDVSEAALARLTADLVELDLIRDRRFMPLEVDVSDSSACAAAIESTIETYGQVDALINNAALGMGLVRPDHMQKPVSTDELSPQLWDRILRVNLSGAWYLSYAALPSMLARKYGRIINVSTSFFTMLRPGFQPYGPAKAGLEAMSASHAAEFAGTGVTVNVVVPGGPADTPMVPDEAPFERSALIPPARMLHPILWLCGEAGDEATGQRYIAADWDPDAAPTDAAAAAGAPTAWPELAQNPVWPGGKPG
ncbi:MAG: SDR family NAD(P)-dependent oxidoreductase [Pseudomonadota bacterium]